MQAIISITNLASLRIAVCLGLFACLLPAASQACDEWLPEILPAFPEEHSELRGLAALAPDDIWAVGSARHIAPGSESHPIALHWNGEGWSAAEVPNPAHPLSRESWLHGVDGVAPDDVWAVGSFIHPDEYDWEPLTLHWDGSAWEYVPTITQPNGEGARFFDVVAVAADDVWAVGTWPGNSPGTEAVPLAARWNGSQWSVHEVPFDTNEINWSETSLSSISALSSTEVWAVGNHQFTQLTHHPFITRWNGSEWSVFDPLPPAEYLGVHDIAAISTDDIWLSVKKPNPDNIFDYFTVFLHWNGTTWTEYPNPGGVFLTALASDDVYAASSEAVSRWNGSSWTLVAQAGDLPDQPLIVEIQALGPCDVRGVGWSLVAGTQQVLSMQLGTGGTTDVAGKPAAGIEITGAYPNPFNPKIRLAYTLDSDRAVRLTVHDLHGRQVAELVDRHQTAGSHEIVWNGVDERGNPLASGIYFARLSAGAAQSSWKLVLAK